MNNPEDSVQQVAGRFCELLLKYDAKRGPIERFAFLCTRNALHSLRRDRANAVERIKHEVSLDALKDSWEGYDD